MRVKITKLTGGSAMRTASMIGYTSDFPEVGRSFTVMNNKPIEGGERNARELTTSRVVKVEEDGASCVLTTATGSRYAVDLLGPPESN